MTYTSVVSTMIDLVGYAEKSKTLEVRFVKSGLLYRYFNVPKKVWKALLNADSKGRFMNTYIVDMYKYEKLKSKSSGSGMKSK